MMKKVDINERKVPEEGKYIYCIIDSNKERDFGHMGIGGRGDDVYAVCYQDIAAVISSSAIIKYPITRENTLAHQRVMEEVMRYHTILPVRFSTIAEGKDEATPEEMIKERVLKERYQEFKELLEEMKDKVELGIKALWRNMDIIFQDIVKGRSEIARLRTKIAGNPPAKVYADKVALGRMVKSALEAKKKREETEILGVLKDICADFRTNKTFGDKMITNAAFLVEKYREKEFDDRLNELTVKYDGRIEFKYVGPVPPCNFVEIVVEW